MDQPAKTHFLVAQLGSRMHYAVPRILAQAGRLDRLCTDLAPVGARWDVAASVLSLTGRAELRDRLASRRPQGLPDERVVSLDRIGLLYALRRRLARSQPQRLRAFLWAGRALCAAVRDLGLGDAGGVYVFNTAGLELLELARHEGRQAVLEQTIAPFRYEQALLLEEDARNPGWERVAAPDATAEAYAAREEAEWEQAQQILCGSAFVRDALVQVGGPAWKCCVVPYGVDSPRGPVTPLARPRSGKLRVLTVGALGLRKGTPYVEQVARRLEGAAEFRLVGSARSVEEPALRRLSEVAEVVGPVPKSRVADHFAWADVFFLPSVCEGSATVIYEALAHGLPVVTTPNAGSVVEHEREGFVLPIRDVEGYVEALAALAGDPRARERAGAAARQRAAGFTVADYGRRLLASLDAPPGAEPCAS